MSKLSPLQGGSGSPGSHGGKGSPDSHGRAGSSGSHGVAGSSGSHDGAGSSRGHGGVNSSGGHGGAFVAFPSFPGLATMGRDMPIPPHPKKNYWGKIGL